MAAANVIILNNVSAFTTWMKILFVDREYLVRLQVYWQQLLRALLEREHNVAVLRVEVEQLDENVRRLSVLNLLII